MRPIYMFDHFSFGSSYNRKCYRKSCRENQYTHFTFNNLFRKSYLLWDNVEKYCRSGEATWSMPIACWIPKATNQNSVSVKLTAFQWELCL